MSYSLIKTETFPTYKSYLIARGDGSTREMFGPLDWTDEEACAGAQQVDEQDAEHEALIAKHKKEIEENT